MGTDEQIGNARAVSDAALNKLAAIAMDRQANPSSSYTKADLESALLDAARTHTTVLLMLRQIGVMPHRLPMESQRSRKSALAIS